MTQSMQAYVIDKPGPVENLHCRAIGVPEPCDGQVLIKVRAFGINRAEWFTREGHSPNVCFPRVLGIECVGEVAASGSGDFKAGQTVAAMMGGMGRDYDGSYAQYTRVPAEHVFPLSTKLEWAQLAALPEMLQTTHGSLHAGLELISDHHLLIRGGTSSIGLAAIALAKRCGARVSATTREKAKQSMLVEAGADEVLIDTGDLQSTTSNRFDRILDLIGTTTLPDSLRIARAGGVVCMTGILGGQWSLPNFEPFLTIPTGVKLTAYSGGSGDISRSQLQTYVELIEDGTLKLRTGPVFTFSKLHDAHRLMESNRANGKIVVTVD